MISCPNETLRTYFANTKSPACPVGYSQEETIKKIWNQGQSPPPAFEGGFPATTLRQRPRGAVGTAQTCR